VTFNADGSIQAYCDETQHSGTIATADIKHAVNPVTGDPDHNLIVLECPDGCGVGSVWPVAGGADAAMGQQMFVNKAQNEGCPCGQVAASDPNSLGEAHVKLQVNRMDGAGRWALG